MVISEVVVFIAYLVFMIAIGVWFFVKNRSGGEKGYFLGGRQMGPWVTALSAGASDMSAWVLMGMPTGKDKAVAVQPARFIGIHPQQLSIKHGPYFRAPKRQTYVSG